MSIFIATFAQFILGALWYSPLMFGKTWMRIMEVEHYTPLEMKKMQRDMVPFYVLQFALTLITTWVLSQNLIYMGESTGIAPYAYALFMWLGYIAPVQVGTVIWGRTKKQFWAKQIFIMTTYQLVAIMIAVLVLTV